jgi:hypothetical protein
LPKRSVRDRLEEALDRDPKGEGARACLRSISTPRVRLRMLPMHALVPAFRSDNPELLAIKGQDYDRVYLSACCTRPRGPAAADRPGAGAAAELWVARHHGPRQKQLDMIRNHRAA